MAEPPARCTFRPLPVFPFGRPGSVVRGAGGAVERVVEELLTAVLRLAPERAVGRRAVLADVQQGRRVGVDRDGRLAVVVLDGMDVAGPAGVRVAGPQQLGSRAAD